VTLDELEKDGYIRKLPVDKRNYDIRYCRRNIKEGGRECYGKSGEISS